MTLDGSNPDPLYPHHSWSGKPGIRRYGITQVSVNADITEGLFRHLEQRDPQAAPPPVPAHGWPNPGDSGS